MPSDAPEVQPQPTTPDRVSIRPGARILSVLRHLNYKPWYALAEFVDNALQSAQANEDALRRLHGPGWRLRVAIDVDGAKPGRISIRDNAAGIALPDFPRAFRPAAAPPDASGLSEFGMGMKSAACWFASEWRVRTSALGESVEREIRFDVPAIVDEELESLDAATRVVGANDHYTEIVLEGLHHVPVGRTLGKIKLHLTDIYREFSRNGFLELRLNDEALKYEEPPVLEAPYVRDDGGPSRTWRREIDFDFGDGLKARGFAALRDPGSHTRSGFALFRRGRLIEGSGEQGYRPPLVFGTPGNYRHLRLFGELHLEGFEISHTKDGFRWDENEEPFLQLLQEKLDDDELPLLRQADGFRSLERRKGRQQVAEGALSNASEALTSSLPESLRRIDGRQGPEEPTHPLADQALLAKRELRFEFRERTWLIKVELSDDPGEGDWLTISDPVSDDHVETLSIRIAMRHPFMVRFAQTDQEDVEAMIRVAAGIAVAEKLARSAGVSYAGTIRRNLNEILRDGLSRAEN